jgi:hypothetical protein
LSPQQQSLINALTPVWEFDKDETLDERSTSLSPERAELLALLIKSGIKVGINSAKALAELRKSKLEIYQPLRLALIQLMQAEGWKEQSEAAADDLLIDLFELFLDTAATRLTPVRDPVKGASKTQEDLKADAEFQAEFKQDVVDAAIKELIGENPLIEDKGGVKTLISTKPETINPSLRKELEERRRVFRETKEMDLTEAAESKPELRCFNMGGVTTKLEYRPFGPIDTILKEHKEEEVKKYTDQPREAIAAVLGDIFTGMGMGAKPSA